MRIRRKPHRNARLEASRKPSRESRPSREPRSGSEPEPSFEPKPRADRSSESKPSREARSGSEPEPSLELKLRAGCGPECSRQSGLSREGRSGSEPEPSLELKLRTAPSPEPSVRLRTRPSTGPTPKPPTKLPIRALLPLATAVFLTSLTETLPAGVLPGLSAGLGVSEPAAGQAVTVYALGTALTAIPLSAVTSGWGRKRLLLSAMAGFAVANTVTAVSGSYPLTMAARFVAGVAAGLAWALLAGHARGPAPEPLRGKAIALVMTGIPVALSFGVPAGTFAGGAFGWRAPFFAMTVLAAVTLAWIAALVPEQPGRRHEKTPVLKALAVPGVAPVLAVTLVFVLAHTILYTYVATFLGTLGLGGQTDLVLLVFGLASLVSIAVVGAHIHRWLRVLTLTGTVLVAVAAAVLALTGGSPALVYVAAALWGLGWGGVPTLLQTAAADAGGEQADAAQAMLVTLWNAAMAVGGVAGGILLDAFGARVFPWSVLVLLAPVLAVVVSARAHGFPRTRPRTRQRTRQRTRRQARTTLPS